MWKVEGDELGTIKRWRLGVAQEKLHAITLRCRESHFQVAKLVEGDHNIQWHSKVVGYPPVGPPITG